MDVAVADFRLASICRRSRAFELWYRAWLRGFPYRRETKWLSESAEPDKYLADVDHFPHWTVISFTTGFSEGEEELLGREADMMTVRLSTAQ